MGRDPVHREPAADVGPLPQHGDPARLGRARPPEVRRGLPAHLPVDGERAHVTRSRVVKHYALPFLRSDFRSSTSSLSRPPTIWLRISSTATFSGELNITSKIGRASCRR